MKICSFLVLALFLWAFSLTAQELNKLADLPDKLKESSGLLHIENRLFTHNDSGDDALIYEIDKTSGAILSSVEVKGASNMDWEDITSDASHIYLADIGNNNGNRHDLKIYKILKADFLNSSDNKVEAEKINIKYKDQSNFTPSPYFTNYDAEALMNFGDVLILFTKNWMNFETDVYTIPKEPGNYDLEKLGSIETKGLITSATLDADHNTAILTGYDEDYAFVTTIENFSTSDLSSLTLERNNLGIPVGTSFQIEAVDVNENGSFFLTSEESFSGKASFFTFKTSATLSAEDFTRVTDSIFPNPASDCINLKIKNFNFAEIYDINGKQVLKSNRKKIQLESLSKGVYVIKAVSENGSKISHFKLLKNN